MSREHLYRLTTTWTGNQGQGTASYAGYSRAHEISAAGKPAIPGSSDPAFRGDPARWNPEELLLASLSACHKLWFLHRCTVAGIVVVAYTDTAEGRMREDADGSGQFVDVVLRPHAALAPGSDTERAVTAHHEAHAACFIARSVNFPVRHEPSFSFADG